MDAVELDSHDLQGRFDYLVEVDKTLKRPVGDTRVITTPYGWLFPEDVYFYNHEDEWLYALGAIHAWRTQDMEYWELLR